MVALDCSTKHIKTEKKNITSPYGLCDIIQVLGKCDSPISTTILAKMFKCSLQGRRAKLRESQGAARAKSFQSYHDKRKSLQHFNVLPVLTGLWSLFSDNQIFFS